MDVKLFLSFSPKAEPGGKALHPESSWQKQRHLSHASGFGKLLHRLDLSAVQGNRDEGVALARKTGSDTSSRWSSISVRSCVSQHLASSSTDSIWRIFRTFIAFPIDQIVVAPFASWVGPSSGTL
jgi:hypothetical protein